MYVTEPLDDLMTIERFEDLKTWQEARNLVQIVYRLTKKEGFHQDRDVKWQVQAAAVSSMGNTAEAHGRYSFEDKRRFLDIALGSSREVQSHIYVALDQDYITQEEFDQAYKQAEIVAQLVSGSIKNLDHQIAIRPSSDRDRRRNAR
jgi:four helix bundle protein